MAQAAQKIQPALGADRESLISIVLGAIVVIIIGALAFRYFTTRSAQVPTENQEKNLENQTVVEVQELPSEVMLEENEDGKQVPTNLPAAYTVQEGDSSWKIAEAFYGSGFNYVDIEKENGLGNDQELVAGMKLTIPRVPVRSSEQAGLDMDTVTSQEESMPTVQVDRPTKGEEVKE